MKYKGRLCQKCVETKKNCKLFLSLEKWASCFDTLAVLRIEPADDLFGFHLYAEMLLDKINGRQLILDKLQMVRDWMMSAFNIDIDAMREEIQRRQYATNEDGSFKFDEWGRYVNALTSPSASDPSRSVMEVLLDEVNQYKALQTK